MVEDIEKQDKNSILSVAIDLTEPFIIAAKEHPLATIGMVSLGLLAAFLGRIWLLERGKSVRQRQWHEHQFKCKKETGTYPPAHKLE